MRGTGTRKISFFLVGYVLLATSAVLAGPEETSNTITDLTQVTAGPDFVKLYPNLSPDGTRLVYMAMNLRGSARRYQVFTIDLRAKNKPFALTPDDASAENPRWVGTTGKVVFDSDRFPKSWHLFMKEGSGAGGLTQIATGRPLNFQADVTRDGKRIVFCSLADGKLKSPRDGVSRIRLFRKPEDLPTIGILALGAPKMDVIGKGVNPTWDPAGQRIAYASNVTGNYEIYVVRADGTQPIQVTSFEGDDVEPAWSPDGKRLAFAREQGRNWNLWMIELDTGRQTQLTVHEAMDGGPAWSRDGTIFFHSDRSGAWDLWSLRPAGYTPQLEEPKPAPRDTDSDGLVDEKDRCVSDPEDVDGFEDQDGCPDPDNDNDSLLDAADRCPREPETRNSYRDDDGCPDETPIKDKMVLFGVLFASGKAELLPSSIPYLDAFADLMKDDAAARIEIVGYTDNQGNPQKNLELSKRRADAVKNYLVLRGIDAARMTTVGMGGADPIADNSTPEGRLMNRRIEVRRVR